MELQPGHCTAPIPKNDGGQPFIPALVAQMLEQLGVVCTVPALSLCTASAHQQGASNGVGTLAAAQGC
jgi:hypothetical protein